MIQKYLQQFDSVNQEDAHPDEQYKWVAISHFRNHWNVEAENFEDMFMEATEKASTLLDGKTMKYKSGITKLFEHGHAEYIREAFKVLFSDDRGDLIERKRNIDQFIDKLNEKIIKYYPISYKFKQDRVSALCYLNFLRPETNYFYKAASVPPWENYIEFGGNVGRGQSFSLINYYRMCDELRVELPNYPELIQKNQERVKKYAVGFDDDLRVLTYDIIYSAWGYELYDGSVQPIPYDVRKKRALRKELQVEWEALKENRDILINQKFDFSDVVGKELQIKSLGICTITGCDEKNLYVKGKKERVLPIFVPSSNMPSPVFEFCDCSNPHNALIADRLKLIGEAIETKKAMDHRENEIIAEINEIEHNLGQWFSK